GRLFRLRLRVGLGVARRRGRAGSAAGRAGHADGQATEPPKPQLSAYLLVSGVSPRSTTTQSQGPQASRCQTARWAYIRRMPRMQVYLPDDLYEAVKDRRLPASELLQDAVRAEVRRRELVAASHRYTAA